MCTPSSVSVDLILELAFHSAADSGILFSHLQLLLFFQFWNFISSMAQENQSEFLGHNTEYTSILKVYLLFINVYYWLKLKSLDSTCHEECQLKGAINLKTNCVYSSMWKGYAHGRKSVCILSLYILSHACFASSKGPGIF